MAILDKICGLFEENQVEHIGAKAFIDFEMRLMILEQIEENVKVEDGWSVFTQYFYELGNNEESSRIKDYLFKMRYQDHRYSSQSKWKQMQKDYLAVPKTLRLYDVSEEGYLIRMTARYENKRDKEYMKHLEMMPTEQKKDIIFGEIGDEVSYEKKKYKALLYDLPGEHITPLEKYRKKKYIDLDKNKDWTSILKEMGKRFEKRPAIRLDILNEQEQLPLKGNIHIVGALGAGKSTYKYAQVYLGVKEHHLKIAMVEESVSHVIETVSILRELGICAVPLVGSSSERKYLEQYLTKYTHFADIVGDEICKELSGNCIVKALASDIESVKFPCGGLYQDGERIDCNYATSCGHMRRFRKLADAEVIVTTPHNLVKGNIPNVIDPYQRSIYEMLYDLTDMIIVDEADGVQSILEDQLMISTQLNYGPYSLMQQFTNLQQEIECGKAPMKRYDKYKFITNLNLLNTVMGVARRVLNKYTLIDNYVLNKRLTPREIFNDLKRILQKEEENSDFLKFLKEYVDITDVFHISEDKIEHPLKELFDKISSIHLEDGKLPEVELKKGIIEFMRKYQVMIPQNKRGRSYDEDKIIQQIGLLITLIQIDYLVKLLSNDYPYLYHEIHGEIKYIEGFNSINKKLQHLIKEPCIGNIYGYKISYKNELEIDVVRYDAVGRSMLEKWSSLKEEIGLRGPVVICLSGTSHSPGSAHYHLKKTPDVLLLGKPEGKISMHFIPQVHKAEYIRISGTGEQKSDWLRILCSKLIIYIKEALHEGEGRKVMLVVNSYEDCRVVGEVLAAEHMRYRIISNENQEKALTKDALENFQEESDEADICVVPLSIIARGYNILNQDGDSYFGSMFFLIRPYMVPGDFSSYIQILHHSMEHIIGQVKQSYGEYGELVTNFRKRCFMTFNQILNMSYWKSLTDTQREVMTWFMLVPIKQAIGRMQRNGNDCTVYFCDSAFCDPYGSREDMNGRNSTLHSLHEVLEQYKGNRVLDNLYHVFREGLKELLQEIENQSIVDEMEEEDLW